MPRSQNKQLDLDSIKEGLKATEHLQVQHHQHVVHLDGQPVEQQLAALLLLVVSVPGRLKLQLVVRLRTAPSATALLELVLQVSLLDPHPTDLLTLLSKHLVVV